ncbi:MULTISPECIES: GTPase HflX [unclassified Paenibacillus]|uniref:GTPase HflX n=1 Tax=unclassified Paenibacillus TaxID=185978 RepID=UPI0024065B5F|nr:MULTISPECIES: GTPase HflX [unclassified Paenibacillus]MDF9841047.1 GTP-binding protein HflX [Paenibacillus sp. PastF-2]MDF9847780.1 GTP-binding protein HflX [Paenibacillus sp. PastM-2]MDF9854349.1 GTP-binding protein HflX [Paenibacillus sp. PastF-1]MDH6479480.1 GTP-binding protein HflX [Paenibacillus sp. PastH-2]MDH6505146.1 GTP-binding protein HflX [Paenibacillus sp. PastM-3]
MSLTHDTQTDVQDRAVLVSLVTDKIKRTGIDPELSLQELVQLAETAGVEVVDVLRQNKETPDSRWFIGKGKVEELRMAADGLGANTAIFDQELSGAQVRNLEEALDLKIIDRTQLILDIFAGRAKTREGIIQVELAQLSYLLPRLSGHGKNLSRLGGGIGTRGPGESKLETDRRHIRGRITELKRQLDDVVKTRELHRERRRKSGAVQVALVGYTNAGKSTLLKQLTDADVYIENQLFATLDPTSRVLQLPAGKEVVLTDTVGFIQNLPHDLVASFRATLEEVNEANLVLHVVDASSPMREEQMEVVDSILQELGAAGKPRVVLFNKSDLCQPEQLEMLPSGRGYLKISAFNPDDLARVTGLIADELAGDTLVFRIPGDRGDLSSLLYRVGEVQDTQYEENDVLYSVRLNKEDYEKWGYKLTEFVVQQD